MPYVHGVREQLGEFARPYPYPPIRQPVPLGEFARPYPYPPIRQPVPLGGWFDDFKDAAADAYYKAYESSGVVKAIDSFSSFFVDVVDKISGEVCGKDVQDQIKVSNRILQRALSQAQSNKAALRSTPANLRPQLDQAYVINTRVASETKALLDKLQSLMNEGYKLGVSQCTEYFRGPASGLGVAPAAGAAVSAPVVIAVVAGIAISAGTIAYGMRLAAEKNERELATASAMAGAVRDASMTTKTVCEQNPSSNECREARQHVSDLANQSNEAFREYAKRKAEEEQAGVTGTIQTVAIAGVVGVLGFMAIKAFSK
jgi:hypothetical protein